MPNTWRTFCGWAVEMDAVVDGCVVVMGDDRWSFLLVRLGHGPRNDQIKSTRLCSPSSSRGLCRVHDVVFVAGLFGCHGWWVHRRLFLSFCLRLLGREKRYHFPPTFQRAFRKVGVLLPQKTTTSNTSTKTMPCCHSGVVSTECQILYIITWRLCFVPRLKFTVHSCVWLSKRGIRPWSVFAYLICVGQRESFTVLIILPLYLHCSSLWFNLLLKLSFVNRGLLLVIRCSRLKDIREIQLWTLQCHTRGREDEQYTPVE